MWIAGWHVDPARCLISLPEGVGLEMVKGSAMLAALGWQQSAVAVSWAPGRCQSAPGGLVREGSQAKAQHCELASPPSGLSIFFYPCWPGDERVAKGRAVIHEAIAHRLERGGRRGLATMPIEDGGTELALMGSSAKTHVQRVLALDDAALRPADLYDVLDLAFP